MSSPSDNDLNRAMMNACGYEICPNNSELWHDAEAEKRNLFKWMRAKDYCGDRNLLPEVIDALPDDAKFEFTELLETACRSKHKIWYGLELPMRSVVVDALKALDKWEPGWDEEGEEA